MSQHSYTHINKITENINNNIKIINRLKFKSELIYLFLYIITCLFEFKIFFTTIFSDQYPL